MFDLKLFLGFPIDPLFEEYLHPSSTPMVKLLMSGGDYLSPLDHGSKRYLGKFPSSCPTIEELELLEGNVISLIKKIAPRYPFEGRFPHLLVIHNHG